MSLKIALLFETTEQRDQFVSAAPSLPEVSIRAHAGGIRSLHTVLQEKVDAVLLALLQPTDADFEAIEAATLREPGVMLLLVTRDTGPAVLKRAMRAGVRDVLPSPLNTECVKAAIEDILDTKSIHSRLAGNDGALHAFMPVKGGCGCTFLVTNLAYLLYKTGKRVLIVDMNLYFGDAATYLTERKAETSLVDVARQSRRLDASLLGASVLKVRNSLHVLTAPDLPYQLEEVTPDSVAALLALARTEYDFVLLDTGRTMDPATVKALDLADRIHLVAVQTLPALHDAQRIVKVLEGLGYGADKTALVLNRYNKKSPVSLEEWQRVTRIKTVHTVPASDEAVQTAINQGVPLAKLAARDPVVRALQDWASALSPAAVKSTGHNWFSLLSGHL